MSSLSLGTLSVKLTALTQEFERKMGGVEKSLKEAEKGIQAIGVAATAVFAAAALATAKFVSVASDANEQMNVIETAFGEKLTPAVLKWAETTSKAVGRSRLDLLEFAGTTQALLAPMIGNQKAAAGMSTRIAQLAVDMGSFNNKVEADVLRALKAGLIGSSEPLLALGVDLRETALSAFALSQGITKSTQDMGAAEKVALRYRLILEKTKFQQGDAAKTAAAFANMTKRIEGQIKDLSNEMGKALLPIVEKVAAVFSGFLDILQGLSPEAKRFIGIGIAIAGALAGIVAAASGLALVLPALIAGFAVLAKVIAVALGPAVLLMAAIAAGIAASIVLIGALRIAWEKNLGGIQEKTQAFIDFHMGGINLLKTTFSDFFTKIAKGWTIVINTYVRIWNGFVSTIESGTNSIIKGIEGLVNILAETRIGEQLGLGKVSFGQVDFGAVKAPEDAGERVVGEIKKIFSADGPIGKAAEKIMDGVGAAWDVGLDTIKQSATELASSLGLSLDDLIPKLDAAGFNLEDLSGSVSGASKALKELDPTKGVVSTGINAAVASLQSSLGRLAPAIGSIFDVLSQQSPAVAAALDNLDEAFGRVFGALEPVFEVLAEAIDVVSSVIDVFASLLSAVTALLGPILDLAGGILGVVGDVLGAIGDAFSALADAISEAFETTAETSANLAKSFGATDEEVESIRRNLGQWDEILEDIAESSRKNGEKLASTFEDLAARGRALREEEERPELLDQVIRMAEERLALAEADLAAQLAAGKSGERARNNIQQLNDVIAGATAEFEAAFADIFNAIQEATGRASSEISDVFVRMASQVADAVQEVVGEAGFISDEVLKSVLASIGIAEETLPLMAEILSALGFTVEGFETLTDTMGKLNDELTGVPEGFKTALRRFQATEADAGAAATGVTGGAVQATAGLPSVGDVIIESMTVVTPNADRFRQDLEDQAAWNAVVARGTPIPAGSPLLGVVSKTGRT